jgi:hypothetical protein
VIERRHLTLIATRAPGYTPAYIPPATEDEFSTETIDYYAVERAISGEDPRPELNRDELREAALWLRAHGVERHQVSVRLCVYERLIKEWEAEAGMLGPDQLCTEADCGKARSGRGLCVNHLAIDRQWRKALAELAVAA